MANINDYIQQLVGAAAGFLQIPPHGGHPCLWL